jgi:hypothetical protein
MNEQVKQQEWAKDEEISNSKEYELRVIFLHLSYKECRELAALIDVIREGSAQEIRFPKNKQS